MISLAEIVLTLAWTFGANGFLIDRQLDDVQALPLTWLEPVTGRIRIVFHGREDWAMASYLPAAVGHGVSATDVSYPRLALFAPYYLAPSGLVDISRMPVDVAEYYFHALIEAALDVELGDAPPSPYADWMRERAVELMSEIPKAQRLTAYTSALADFGAYVLAVRNEIARAADRQAAIGRDVCRHLEQPASLFGLWNRSLASGRYSGGYFAPESGGSSDWVTSRQALHRADKERFLEELFDVSWTGDPRRDFEEICAGL